MSELRMADENRNTTQPINPFKQGEVYQAKLIELMKEYELVLSELYQSYALRFTEEAELWKMMAEEEKTHAYWIQTLLDREGDGTIYFDEKRFSIIPLEQLIKDAKRESVLASSENTNLLRALSVAFDIENGMIENGYFKAFAGDSAEFKNVIEMLSQGTIVHRDRVRVRWQEELGKITEKEGIFSKMKKWFS